MTIKLNSFILPDSVIQKMKVKIEDSRFKNIEVGFNLCTENGTIHDESPCTGTECSIRIPKGCKRGKHVGLFHTHPHTSSEPSIHDIANAYYIGISCIGSTEEKDIKCYVRKDKNYTKEGLENIIATSIRYESTSNIIQDHKKLIKVRNDLKNQYLNTIDGI